MDCAFRIFQGRCSWIDLNRPNEPYRSGQMLQVASPASLHFLGLSPKALGSGLQPFKALTFATETAATIIDPCISNLAAI